MNEPEHDDAPPEPIIIEDECWRIASIDAPEAPRVTDPLAETYHRDEWRRGWQVFQDMPREPLSPEVARKLLFFPPD